MNILILNWRDPKNPKSGGAEAVTLEHAKAWVKAGHRVTWFTSQFPNGRPKEIMDGINIVRRGNFISVYLHAPFFYLFSGNKFDLVVDEIHGIPFFTPIYVRVSKLAFIHEVAGDIWHYMFPFPINKVGKTLEPLFYFLYRWTKFMTVSPSTKHELVNLGIPEKNIDVILNGLSIKPVDGFPTKESKPTFLFVSRVVKMKGVEEVIKAFFHILKTLKDGQLWIVGDGDPKYLEYLRKTMDTYTVNNKVKLFGKVSEDKKLELMSRAHLLLHASRKEGWGLVVIEAASRGTPAVVYNVGGLRDSVINGKTGIVLSQNTPLEMAAQAIRVIMNEDKYRRFQKNSIEWSRSLTWEKATEQSLQLINDLF